MSATNIRDCDLPPYVVGNDSVDLRDCSIIPYVVLPTSSSITLTVIVTENITQNDSCCETIDDAHRIDCLDSITVNSNTLSFDLSGTQIVSNLVIQVEYIALESNTIKTSQFLIQVEYEENILQVQAIETVTVIDETNVAHVLCVNDIKYRYWRCLGGNSHYWCYIREIEFREISGGSDVLSGGTASACDYLPGTGPSKACDDDAGTYWCDTNDHAHIWSYDFGSGVTKNIKEVVITPQASDSTYIWSSFSLQYSENNSDWYTLDTWDFNYSGQVPHTFTVGVDEVLRQAIEIVSTTESVTILVVDIEFKESDVDEPITITETSNVAQVLCIR